MRFMDIEDLRREEGRRAALILSPILGSPGFRDLLLSDIYRTAGTGAELLTERGLREGLDSLLRSSAPLGKIPLTPKPADAPGEPVRAGWNGKTGYGNIPIPSPYRGPSAARGEPLANAAPPPPDPTPSKPAAPYPKPPEPEEPARGRARMPLRGVREDTGGMMRLLNERGDPHLYVLLSPKGTALSLIDPQSGVVTLLAGASMPIPGKPASEDVHRSLEYIGRRSSTSRTREGLLLLGEPLTVRNHSFANILICGHRAYVSRWANIDGDLPPRIRRGSMPAPFQNGLMVEFVHQNTDQV